MNRLPPDAFEVYVSLGPGRSYSAVAKHYGVTKKSVTKRATREGWQQRLAKIEAEARQKADTKLAETYQQISERHIKLLRAIEGRALKALSELPLTKGMDAVRALDIAIRGEQNILRPEHAGRGMTLEQLVVASMKRGERPPVQIIVDTGVPRAEGEAQDHPPVPGKGGPAGMLPK